MNRTLSAFFTHAHIYTTSTHTHINVGITRSPMRAREDKERECACAYMGMCVCVWESACVCIYASYPWYGEGRDEHGAASQEEDRTDNRKNAPEHFKKKKNLNSQPGSHSKLYIE